MKNIKSIAYSLSILGAISFTSCDLELMPLNEVVLENFWTDKSDVQSVVNSCYVGMQTEGFVSKSLIWGECRSDNISEGSGASTDLKQLLRGQLKSTNGACDWSPLYVVINRCNTVLKYAPEVAAKDPNYTETDLAINIAEVKALRAICYLTLVKSFNDVPFSFEPSIDDNQNYLIGASPADSVLDVLIADIESCKDNSPRKYSDDYKKNSGRITRDAMYAILADLYLWRASDYELSPAMQKDFYQKCVECCDYILNHKLELYEEEDASSNWTKRQMDKYVWQHYGYPLLAEEETAGVNNSGPLATQAIFGSGNSFESIFELTYTSGTTNVKNTDVSSMYGGNDSGNSKISPSAVASETLLSEELTSSDTKYSDQEVFPVCTDYRSITTFQYVDNGSFNILKYTMGSNNPIGSDGNNGKVKASSWAAASSVTQRSYDDTVEPWIIYRMTDIMLMRAEAEICLAGLINKDASPMDYSELQRDGQECFDQDTLLYNDAFNLIKAVYMRSNPSAQNATGAAPSRDSYVTYDQFITLLENERHRELIFEGKRYFDLVRRSRREGNTSHFAEAVSSKFGNASNAVKIKMSMMEFMYLPYSKSQLKINSNLHQNPAYDDEEDYVKN